MATLTWPQLTALLVAVSAGVCALLALLTQQGDAAWPGANGRILYSNSNQGIWSMNPDGTDREQLTAFGDQFPSSSPDGSRIVFERSSRVFTINSDGSNPQLIADGETPSWSPDGTRIVFTRDGLIMEMDTDGDNVETLTQDPDVFDANPVYQPGGDKIAFLRRHIDSGTSPSSALTPDDVYIMNSDTSVQNVSQTPSYYDGPPDWSPDGTQLAFRSSGGDIYTWDVGSPAPPQMLLDSEGAVIYTPSWSPDGTRIAFARGDPVSRNARGADPQGTAAAFLEVWTINADGTNSQLVPGSAGPVPGERDPDWGVPSSAASPAPSPAPQLINGDVDCNEDVLIGDAQKLARSLIDLPVTQTQPCPEIGGPAVIAGVEPPLWGDVDCDGDVRIGDAQKIARWLIDLQITQTQPCPPIGEPF